MGAIKGLLGIGGGGGNFQAQSAGVVDPLAQLGWTNQIARYPVETATTLASQTAQQVPGAIAKQNDTYGAMQDLGSALALQAQGQGPNPAAAQLAQATGANVAQTGALMAGQRGASSNVGLIARQAGQQGAATQQQAAGQAATLQAQQQIAAQQALQQQQQAEAALATQQVNQGVGATSAASTAAGNYQGNLAGELQGYNQANVSNAAQMNSANAGVQGEVAKGAGGFLGKVLGFAEGGDVPASTPAPAASSGSGPRSFVGRFLKGAGVDTPAVPDIVGAAKTALGVPDATIPGLIGSGVSALVNAFAPSAPAGTPLPADRAMSSGDTMMAAKGGMAPAKKKDFRSGGGVPGKAKVKGDSYANDTVDAKLSPGEVVIPRHVMQSPDPVNNAARFVAAVMAKRGRR